MSRYTGVVVNLRSALGGVLPNFPSAPVTAVQNLQARADVVSAEIATANSNVSTASALLATYVPQTSFATVAGASPAPTSFQNIAITGGDAQSWVTYNGSNATITEAGEYMIIGAGYWTYTIGGDLHGVRFRVFDNLGAETFFTSDRSDDDTNGFHCEQVTASFRLTDAQVPAQIFYQAYALPSHPSTILTAVAARTFMQLLRLRVL